MLHFRADEHDPGIRTALREPSAFGQKAVAGVDGATAGGVRSIDHRLLVEIRCGTQPFQSVGFICDASVQAGGVVLGVNRHGAQAEIGRGTRDADGDFAAIGDEQGVEVMLSVPEVLEFPSESEEWFLDIKQLAAANA